MDNRNRTSKAVLIIVMLFGLGFLAIGRLESLANAGVFALIYIGALFNRLDSRRQGYKASFSAAGVTATVEAAEEDYYLPPESRITGEGGANA